MVPNSSLLHWGKRPLLLQHVLCFSGNYISQVIQKSIADGVNSLVLVLITTGLQKSNAEIVVEKLRQGNVFFQIKSDDSAVDNAIKMLQNTGGELIQKS